jgi:NAD(P)-dependent dehydrogenase (short-subunit alcohol dehydrogenase family)
MVAPFAGKVALITGAAGGIGHAVAEAFAEAGAALALVDRAAEQMSLEGLGDALAISCDVADAAALEAAVDRTLDRFGRWDALINVAGIMLFKPIEAHSREDWQHLLAINLIAPALLTGHALRHLPRGGSIVNIASVHASRTSAMVSSYAASTAAWASLTRSTAIEGQERGIRCNAILPGAIDTALLRSSPNIRSGVEVIDPADIGQPEDIAALARFLASDEARFITGAEMVADGGRMARL